MTENDDKNKESVLELLENRYKALDEHLENDYIDKEVYSEHLDKLNSILENFILNSIKTTKDNNPPPTPLKDRIL